MLINTVAFPYAYVMCTFSISYIEYYFIYLFLGVTILQMYLFSFTGGSLVLTHTKVLTQFRFIFCSYGLGTLLMLCLFFHVSILLF